ncbi:hypothetical protein [Pleurocapsa sp. PCC 7319]|uniref:hypothetical protein n=1 Tax=Pleurocapsa sp. PCC 7319 TaxID=118161 RepID=UPI0003492B8C|nr:hypothetical protein [Pleurocapsa sp. PCC 7319]
MNQSELSPLEKAIAKKIDRTKDKASQPGYLRKLVAKLHLRIEAALARGCEYDDLAQSITEMGVKISTATLKQYHTEHRRQLEKEAGEISETVDSVLPPEQPKEIKPKINTQSNQPDRKQSAVDKLFASK